VNEPITEAMSTNWIHRVFGPAKRADATPQPPEELLEAVEQVVEELPAEPEPERGPGLDPLTEVYDRRYFVEALAKEIAHDDAVVAAVLLVGIDRFELVNEMHGRSVGDAVLRVAAARLGAILRETDCVARWAGDEFAILAVGMTPDGITGLAERARRALSSSPIATGDVAVELAASVGAVLTSPELHTTDDVLAAAGQALHEAKVAGRDCVHVHDPTVTLPEQP
jgi:diguanylate cyclase (GGDEF)-like protein